ncbi:MAG: alanine:cation symporter family protein [Duodenibacillus sp.]|nr:alanine:cation symporter family protein [Duodenibacillus sp.]
MQELTSIVSSINGVLWGPFCLIPLLVGAGIYFSVKLRFVQVKRFGFAVRKVFANVNLFGAGADHTGMSQFQSLATAVAAQVGTGNLAGVATAIAMGGPGAIFWMWLAAFFGMATIFVEAVLAQLYKREVGGVVRGGPAYYISEGLGSKALAGFFSVAIIIALGLIGNMVQANSIAGALDVAFQCPPFVAGGFMAVLATFVFLGGVRRIAATTEKMVPLMAVLYLIGGFIVLGCYWDGILPAFKMIFVGAFDPQAATGGIVGATVKEAVRYGVARGLFSNEAGMGSTPHAHALARVSHPAEQGFFAMIGVFIDTFIVLNMTAMVILATGALDGKHSGIALTQHAFQMGLGSWGLGFVAVCLFFFAFSTIISWYFFAEQNVLYLLGRKFVTPFKVLVVGFVFLGSLLQVDLVWELADLFNGLMVLPNLIALLALGKMVKKALDEMDFGQ